MDSGASQAAKKLLQSRYLRSQQVLEVLNRKRSAEMMESSDRSFPVIHGNGNGTQAVQPTRATIIVSPPHGLQAQAVRAPDSPSDPPLLYPIPVYGTVKDIQHRGYKKVRGKVVLNISYQSLGPPEGKSAFTNLVSKLKSKTPEMKEKERRDFEETFHKVVNTDIYFPGLFDIMDMAR